MKRITLLVLLLISFACKKKSDPCSGVVCQNNGICLDGSCDCELGYEGDNCSLLTRDNYTGNYTVVDTITAYGVTVRNYNSIIAIGGNDLKINISNLYSLEDVYSISAIVEASITKVGFDIPSQDVIVYDTTTWNIVGSGVSYGGGVIEINYTLTDEFTNETYCKATFTK